MTKTYAHNKPTSHTSPYNSFRFAMEMARDAQMTCTIVKVKKVGQTSNQVAAVGTVDVQPLVQMVDGIKQTTDHDTVHNLPYLRMIGGKSAVIIDPQVGDIGIVVTGDRDVSGVKQKKDKAPPGSARKYNIADGFFLGSVLSDKPQHYVRFDASGNVEITPDGGVTAVWIQPNRIDLGMKNAPHAVMTADGASQKVFAVINESGSQD